MNDNLIRIATSIQPAPDSQLARAIAAMQQRDEACTPFEKMLDVRQAELAAAERVLALSAWNTEPGVIREAQAQRGALTVVIPKITAQLEAARADVQRTEATLSQLVQKARGLAQSIRELADDNIEIQGLSPASRRAELDKQRAELRALIGRDSASFDDAQLAVRHGTELRRQVQANLQHQRATA